VGNAASRCAGRPTSTPCVRGQEPARVNGFDSAGCNVALDSKWVALTNRTVSTWKLVPGCLASGDCVPPSQRVVATLANRSKPFSKEAKPGHSGRTRCKVGAIRVEQAVAGCAPALDPPERAKVSGRQCIQPRHNVNPTSTFVLNVSDSPV
jgi:hypothetical protein